MALIIGTCQPDTTCVLPRLVLGRRIHAKYTKSITSKKILCPRSKTC